MSQDNQATVERRAVAVYASNCALITVRAAQTSQLHHYVVKILVGSCNVTSISRRQKCLNAVVLLIPLAATLYDTSVLE